MPGGSNSTKSVLPLGQFNHFLRFNQTGSPYLEYKSGAACENVADKWSSKIEFLCASDGMAEGPVVVENDHCQLVVHFVTRLVCQKQVRYIDLVSVKCWLTLYNYLDLVQGI